MPNRKPNYLIFEDRNTLYEDVLTTNPRPVPGTMYTVPEGAWIDTISYKAYGTVSNSAMEYFIATNRLINGEYEDGIPRGRELVFYG